MKVLELGHINLCVRSLDFASEFYRETLGFPEVARGTLRGRRIAFYSLGTRHHDLALLEVGVTATEAQPKQVGLNHFGLKVGDSVAALRQTRDWLSSRGVTPFHYVDHRVCQSLHIHDPDGNAIELYVDSDPRLWIDTPQAMVCAGPLQLD